jgi:hypothetical protein
MSTQLPSGAVGKDCQRRLLSQPRFVRAVTPRIILLLLLLLLEKGIIILLAYLQSQMRITSSSQWMLALLEKRVTGFLITNLCAAHLHQEK